MSGSRMGVLVLFLCAGLAACGGDPMKASNAALAAKDPVKAEALLDQLLKAEPNLHLARVQHFAVCRYLALQGEAFKQDLFQNKAIADYDALVKDYGLSPDYKDMEASLRANAQAGADLAAARKPLYGE